MPTHHQMTETAFFNLNLGFMLMLIVFAPKSVDGKDTHITWPTRSRFRVRIPARSFLFGLIFFCHVCLIRHIRFPSECLSLFVPPSQPSDEGATRPWTTPPPTTSRWDPADTLWSRCIFLLLMRPFPPQEQVSEMRKNIVTFNFPPDKCGVGTEKSSCSPPPGQ